MNASDASEKQIYAGADVGASHTKVALIDASGKLLGHAVKKSGVDFFRHRRRLPEGCAGNGRLPAGAG